MKPVMEKWSLVILGKWNTAILSPKWVSENLFEVESINVLFPIVGGLPPKYSSDNIEIAVSRDRIAFAPLKDEDGLLQKIENIAIKVLNTLKFTPVSAFGENFHFEIESTEAPDILKKSFRLKDNEPLGKFGDIKQTSIRRSVANDERILNFTVEDGNISNTYALGFNCHYEADSAEKAERLMKNTFIENKKFVFEILREAYQLKIEEAE